MRVGVYGGSFDPPHDGHRHVARTALARLGLDQVIWLVSPRNPLKTGHDPAELPARMAATRRLAQGPSMRISDLERRIDARYTLDTLRVLKARYPQIHFVWIMGADNLAGFHRWLGWADIFREFPIAVVARPGVEPRAALSPAARRFAAARLPGRAARALATCAPPAWVYLAAPLKHISSTALRAQQVAESAPAQHAP